MKRKVLKILIVILLISLPVILHQTYRWMTALPDRITIAAGHSEGRYYGMAEQLKSMLQEQLPIKVEILETQGSLENLKLLREGKADLGFYQPGTEFELTQREPGPKKQKRAVASDNDEICFIANLYSQVMHVIVPLDSEIISVSELKGKRIAIGLPGSGDLAASLPLLDHLQLNLNEIDPAYLTYREIEEQFGQKRLDAVFMTLGVEAPILHQLLESGQFRLLEIPYIGALTRRETHFYPYEIPAGMYSRKQRVIPERNLPTVACGALLLTRESVSDELVSVVTSQVLHQNFSRQMHLNELSAQGNTFARENQGFPMHDGADHVYNPELKPFLNSEFVEATEGMRSFIVSMLIAGYLLIHWFQKRRMKAKEHRLDRYIRQLVDIENQQMKLDGNKAEDGPALLTLLDDVTSLRQHTLKQFSAHELNEDRATDVFLEMCHALSDKINAKLLGWKIDRLGEKMKDD
ncbi:ABC transporter, phosphonate, periplasmic substrate-binding protein [Gimesia panareensis]|uniref:ABC transporter, phosphonate, periplasmic substrate-binding protein n=1 Tax=Gimesia panareensis TaxID=2527978 RepID=A0A518FHU4_9PLAN|nr:TAXI family TRAP transporter solute-binding subunit [Gimesia panareensis]QDV15830.1 ABC transporter, phosphonate, periplasmic substrate-binding protein [Gimesia panareensis]